VVRLLLAVNALAHVGTLPKTALSASPTESNKQRTTTLLDTKLPTVH
jgi:hypothetical protein